MISLDMPEIAFGITVSFFTPLFISFPTFYLTFSLIIRLYEAEQKLLDLAMNDPLTGIANRRSFFQFAEEMLSRSKRNKNQIAILMVDVDYFKKYNDFYGHQKGDLCLKKIATILKETIHRPEDLAARYGGEEFIVALGDTSLEGTEKLANAICQSIRDHQIQHQSSPVADHITVSIGIAHQQVTQDTTIARLIEAADKNLYKAKENGRNQTFKMMEDA